MSTMPKRVGERADASVEQRRYPRAACECYIQVQSLRPRFGDVNHGLSVDLGEGGVQMRAFRPLPVDSRVMVQLGCPEEPDAIRTLGYVVWASRAQVRDQWMIGIAFTDLNHQTRQRIRRTAQRLGLTGFDAFAGIEHDIDRNIGGDSDAQAARGAPG